MPTSIAIEDSAKLLQALDPQHEDWIIARAMEIVERRMFRGGEALPNPYATINFLRLKLAQEANEVFAALFLDGLNRVIAYEELFKGTVDGASVYPRVVLSRVLKHNAVSMIFAHNHPSGNPDPSEADRRLTDQLKTVLAAIDVRVLDHIIVGQGQPFSFAERGLL